MFFKSNWSKLNGEIFWRFWNCFRFHQENLSNFWKKPTGFLTSTNFLCMRPKKKLDHLGILYYISWQSKFPSHILWFNNHIVFVWLLSRENRPKCANFLRRKRHECVTLWYTRISYLVRYLFTICTTTTFSSTFESLQLYSLLSLWPSIYNEMSNKCCKAHVHLEKKCLIHLGTKPSVGGAW